MTGLWKNTTAVTLMALLTMTSSVLAQDKKELQIEGSTTVGPIADAFAEVFMKMNPGCNITVKKTGSGDGAAALVDGRCDVATMSRFMKDQEFKKAVESNIFPVAHAVALDGVCVIVNPSNPVSDLTTEQVRKIYTGEITNWKDLGGADMPIVAISRDSSSGTFETFEGLIMNKQKIAGSVETVGSNPQAHSRVKTTPAAVAYVGFGFVDNEVKALKVDGIMPTRRTIAAGEYPVARPLYLFTNGYPKMGSLLYNFINLYLTEKGQEIVEAKGFVPLTNY